MSIDVLGLSVYLYFTLFRFDKKVFLPIGVGVGGGVKSGIGGSGREI